MKRFLFALLFSVVCISASETVQAQSNPSVEELQQFFNGQQLLVTYREGEAVYGTYYFLEIHYCPNGYYGLYGNTVKQTVLGNEQRSNWQEYGNWKVINQNGLNGIHYVSLQGTQQFFPIYKLENGDMFIREGVSIVKQGQAICN
ncbi:hypothetical protein J1N09_06290 [Aureitalea sp. L0-47]|uniref:hypothetical protein n=1 Tax=Aureitalea sp. L0-47 TaxID=2816962 RepID=UPI002237AC19|nr:hypothetical protein [Aureitalea sp. L0-47]MCW5519438.1 hypothetical protein [Aureitalea sp. L0-47]